MSSKYFYFDGGGIIYSQDCYHEVV